MSSTVKLTVAHIRAAWPVKAGENIAHALGTTPRTGRWIASTGQVPKSLRARLIAIVDRAIERNERELHRLRAELGRQHDGAPDPAEGDVGPGAALVAPQARGKVA